LFVDEADGQRILRGVNLGGDCKVPWPDGGTENPSDFSDHRDVSFIGRPFPMADADEHLGRLAHWGFNTLRLLTTWEALEHRGPGQYDTDYLDYLTEVCRRAGEHGLYLFIDFHQDVWSRMTGGDGAPGWTFEAVGLDFTRFPAADAAHVMQARYDYANPAGRQSAYPQMSWGSNHRLPSTAIMWTLFWGGRLFTPAFSVEGRNVQDFLQGRYLGAMDQVARRLAEMPHVLGFDTLNEPGVGWLTQPLSYRHLSPSREHPEWPRIGPALAPIDGLALAQGVPVTAPVLTRSVAGAPTVTGERTLNTARIRIWRDDMDCPFERAGAYAMRGDFAAPLDEHFFRTVEGRTVALSEDAFGPLYAEVAATVRRHQPAWSVFAEMDPFARAAGRHFPADLPERSVNAGHWYDTAILYLKRFNPQNHVDAGTGRAERGADAIRARYVRHLADLASEAIGFAGGAPTLIGEFGIPYDLDDGAAYAAWSGGERDGVWDSHALALSLAYDAMDELGLHSTQWNYTASNRNDLRIGDCWNQEDLSIFSRDQQSDPTDPDSGGRAVEGFCRPYARRIQGRLASTRFDRASGILRVDFTADASIEGSTEIYAPRSQYRHGFVVRFEGAPAELEMSPATQIVTVRALASGPAWLALEPMRSVRD
jgi:hypothetical protein